MINFISNIINLKNQAADINKTSTGAQGQKHITCALCIF